MFLMPQAGEESVEGKDKEHPIDLETYSEADLHKAADERVGV